jgi:hypothetical protein
MFSTGLYLFPECSLQASECSLKASYSEGATIRLGTPFPLFWVQPLNVPRVFPTGLNVTNRSLNVP